MNIAKFQPIHAVVANAPQIVSAMGEVGLGGSRYFSGTGSPTSSTLLAGNGKYNAAKSGYVISALLVAGGSSYAVGNVLTISGGTGTALQITIEGVDNSGSITDWKVTRVGAYTAFPSNTASVTGGVGSGATFNLNFPQPDFYIDTTTPTAPVLYVCTTAGTNSTSIWAQVSGGGTSNPLKQFKITSDGGDYWMCNPWDGTTLGVENYRLTKPKKLRAGTGGITSENIRGRTQSYTYTPVNIGAVVGYYIREVSVGGALVERDVVIPDMMPGDILDGILHPNYNSMIIGAMVATGGTTYAVNDILIVLGGGSVTPATIKVTAVSSGVITTAVIQDPGEYTTLPTGPVSVTGGSGTGATFDITTSIGYRALADGCAWAET